MKKSLAGIIRMEQDSLTCCLSIFLLIFSAITFVNNSYAGESLFVAEVNAYQIAPLDIDFLSTGPRDNGTKGLRVSFLVSEIYYSIIVEEISYGLTEGDDNKITKSYLLNGFSVGEQIGVGRLVNLRFVKWISWNELEVKEDYKHFLIRYMGDGKFKISTQ